MISTRITTTNTLNKYSTELTSFKHRKRNANKALKKTHTHSYVHRMMSIINMLTSSITVGSKKFNNNNKI